MSDWRVVQEYAPAPAEFCADDDATGTRGEELELCRHGLAFDADCEDCASEDWERRWRIAGELTP